LYYCVFKEFYQEIVSFLYNKQIFEKRENLLNERRLNL